nr:MAG: putative transmembrane protein [Polycipiviridae sp.]
MLPGIQIQFTNLPNLLVFHGMIKQHIGIPIQKAYFLSLKTLLIILSLIGRRVIKTYKEFETSLPNPRRVSKKILRLPLHHKRLRHRPTLQSLLPLWERPKRLSQVD